MLERIKPLLGDESDLTPSQRSSPCVSSSGSLRDRKGVERSRWFCHNPEILKGPVTGLSGENWSISRPAKAIFALLR